MARIPMNAETKDHPATVALIQELRDALNDMLDNHGAMNAYEQTVEDRAKETLRKAGVYLDHCDAGTLKAGISVDDTEFLAGLERAAESTKP